MNRWRLGLLATILAAVNTSISRGSDESTTAQDPAPSAANHGPSPSAGISTSRPGDHNLTIRVGEMERRYTVHVPPSYDGKKPVPVVIMLHGGGGTERAAATETGWGAKSDQAGFLAVFPEALARDPAKPSSFAGNPQLWNDGSDRFYPGQKAPDVIWEFFQKHPSSAQSKGTP